MGENKELDGVLLFNGIITSWEKKFYY